MTKTVTAHLPNVDQTGVKHKLLVGLCAGMLLLIGAVPASAAEGTQSALTAVVGQGTGYGVVSSTAEDQGTFATQITVNVQRARPNTTFIVQRAVDLNPNGICTIDFGWFTFSEPGGTFTTSAGGAGATHIERHAGAPFVSGVQFDVILRTLGSDGTELRSDCMTVTVQ